MSAPGESDIDIDQWLRGRPARYRDGQSGFDVRLARDLAEVGCFSYTADELAPAPAEAIPVLVDWLNHVEDRIGAKSGRHFIPFRGVLIAALLSPAARRNRGAIDALFHQVLHARPPLDRWDQSTALQALDVNATRQDFDRMVGLLDVGMETPAVSWVIHYLGQFKDKPEAQRIVRSYIDCGDPYITREVVAALGRFGDPADLVTVERFADHESRDVRMKVRSARKKLIKKAENE